MSQEPFDPSKLDIDFTADTSTDPQKNTAQDIPPAQAGATTTPTPASQPNQEVSEQDFFAQDDTIDIETLSTILTDESFSLEEVQEYRAQTSQESQTQSIIFDINIKTVGDVADILLKNSYDFAACVPDMSGVKMSFKKDGILKETRWIEYGVYMQLVIETKTLIGADVRVSNQEQQGKGQIILRNKNIDITGKTAPNDTESGEMLFLKAALAVHKKKVSKKKQSSISIGQAFGFLGVMLLFGLIIGGGFLAFVVVNAQTVDDVRFFSSLGINLNDINSFIKTAVTVIFSIILVIEMVILAIFLFKAVYTKKEFKAKKIGFSIVSGLILLLTFASGGAWMFVDKKANDLPVWDDVSKGAIQFWNNDLYVHPDERLQEQAFYADTNSGIIGPVNMKIDVRNLTNTEEKGGFVVDEYEWRINGTTQITKNPEIFYTFDSVGVHRIRLTLRGSLRGTPMEKPVENVPDVNISHLVLMSTAIQPNGGKLFSFDAQDMSNIGDIEWSTFDEQKGEFVPQETTFLYNPQKVYSGNTQDIVAFRGVNDPVEAGFRKFFVLRGENNDIFGKIAYEISSDNDLVYTFSLDDVESKTGGPVEMYEWLIDGKETTKVVGPRDDITATKKNSTVKHTFQEYGTYDIQVTMTNKSGRFVVISDTITTAKKVELKNRVKILVDGSEITNNIRYFANLGEYRVDGDIPAPTEVVFDASTIFSENPLYRIEAIEWDVGNTGVIDASGKKFTHFFPIAENTRVGVHYTLQHIRDDNERVSMHETIYMDFGTKEALLVLDITQGSEYVPTDVRFDASASRVQGENIVKFIYDYGDGTPIDSRDAVNPAHTYLTSGNYTIKLTVVTASGKQYSIQKSLILKDMEEIAKIKSSRKKVRVGEEITFDSTQSEGLIMQYTWDFGDGDMSSEANPKHTYQKPGTYTVKLRLDFSNHNSKRDEIRIEVE